ncbi:MAG: N-acetylglucosamine-6-phosphate deacetylase, partial [Clostridia bacterium]|nr:N-acetylglucosamine-6-phosphate deacetylase [Clostridia bacterium]
MKGFKNAKVYVDGEGIKYADVAIENGKIVNIGTGLDISEPFEIPQNAVVCPAFIDEHVHGAAGADAMDGNIPALRKIAVALAKEGTANFLATTMTQSKENITAALSAVKRYMAKPHGKGAKILGVHLEGPFISAKHVGAQPVEYLAEPDVKVFRKYYAASGKHIKLVTLAPEEPHSLNLIKYLAKNGITASAGHTDAGVKEIETAKKCGLSCVTHTYNAQRGVHHREIGVAGSALLFDDLYSEVICDLIHVSGPAIRLLIKSKPKDKVVLITDAMRAKGLKDGVSELGGQT